MVNGNMLELVSKWKFNGTLHMLDILKIVEIARKLHSVVILHIVKCLLIRDEMAGVGSGCLF